MKSRLTIRCTLKTDAKGIKVKSYLVDCECGTKDKIVRAFGVDTGAVLSCGCYQRECARSVGISNKTHGKTNTPTITVYRNMLVRCFNPTCKEYPYYGGRGVTVCDRWNPKMGGSFENFFEDMGDKPEDLSLDRIDVNTGYSKDNCRWATKKEQAINKRDYARRSALPKGVYFTTSGKYAASIRVNGKQTHLGSFATIEEASITFKVKWQELHGEFLKLASRSQLDSDIDQASKQEEDDEE